MTYQANVDGQPSYEIQVKPGAILLNNHEITLNLVKINEQSYHILSQNQSFNVEVEEINLHTKKFLLKINGKPVEITLQDELDQLMATMGLQSLEENHDKEIKAPMPGLILQIAIEEGQKVNAGDTLLTLEAMKMENVLKSPTQGVVSAIKVKEQQSVEKNQVLVIIE